LEAFSVLRASDLMWQYSHNYPKMDCHITPWASDWNKSHIQLEEEKCDSQDWHECYYIPEL